MSAPHSRGSEVDSEKSWNAARGDAAEDAERSQVYSNIVEELGAAYVLAWIYVTIPNELEAPLRP